MVDNFEIKETSLSYRIGQIDAKLSANESDHKRIMEKVDHIELHLNAISKCLGEIKEDLGQVKGRSAVWGSVFGSLFGLIVGILFGWLRGK